MKIPDDYLFIIRVQGGDRYDAEFLRLSDRSFRINSYIQTVKHGSIQCTVISENLLKIDDLLVEKDVKRKLPFIPFLRLHQSARRNGLGSALLLCVEGISKSLGIRSICGGVVNRDIQKTPDLLSWYARRGYIEDSRVQALVHGTPFMKHL